MTMVWTTLVKVKTDADAIAFCSWIVREVWVNIVAQPARKEDHPPWNWVKKDLRPSVGTFFVCLFTVPR